MDTVLQAISYAGQRHHGQMRKDGATPYVTHPFRVLLTVSREFGETDPLTLVAAALHDVIEDTTTDFDDVAKTFGAEAARAVALLTKDKRLPEDVREEAYFAGLASAPLAVRLVKIADTLDNLRDARHGHGNVPKTIRKADQLFALYGADAHPLVQKALAILRAELAR